MFVCAGVCCFVLGWVFWAVLGGFFVLWFLCVCVWFWLFSLYVPQKPELSYRTPTFRNNEAGRYVRVDPFITFDKF